MEDLFSRCPVIGTSDSGTCHYQITEGSNRFASYVNAKELFYVGRPGFSDRWDYAPLILLHIK
jgi:hypothetical protein